MVAAGAIGAAGLTLERSLIVEIAADTALTRDTEAGVLPLEGSLAVEALRLTRAVMTVLSAILANSFFQVSARVTLVAKFGPFELTEAWCASVALIGPDAG